VLFYFKLTDGRIVEEVEGLELSDLPAAREEAMGLARDLARGQILGRNWSKWTVIVTDGTGHEVLAVSISRDPAGN
jgi:uncharacterized protein DUF6894